MLTGESDPVLKDPGDPLMSGSHVVAGNGYAVVTAVGADSYASRLTVEVKRHSLVHSELRYAVNRILVYISWILGPVIIITLIGRIFTYGGWDELLEGAWRRAVRDAVASVVGMIPEGLVLLISLAFGVAAIQLAARKVLVQELAAVEVLARVDVLCLDKTGTLTTGELVFERLIAFPGVHERESGAAVAAFASDDAANSTTGALARHFSASGLRVLRRIPFSSATKYSAVCVHDGTRSSSWYFGAPERLLERHPAELAEANRLAASGRRTLALVRVQGELPDDDVPPAALPTTAAALIVFREQLRDDAAQTLHYFAEQGVRTVVMSGDNPVTVGAVASSIGVEGRVVDATGLDDDDRLADALESARVLGRVTPDQKRAAVRLLKARGHVVGMTGDGVNDAMAVKDADLGIAMGAATAVTKAVSRIVLLDNRFDRLPDVLALGRRVIANVERVANIFLTKTVYGIVFALVSAIALVPFPFLPRQLTLVSSLAIGIPSFFLALAPNSRIYTPGVLRRVLWYSIPSGLIVAATCLAAFLPLLAWVPVDRARSATTITLFCVSLWIVCVLARPLTLPRLALIGGVSAAMLLACVIPFTRSFFMMEVQLDLYSGYAVLIGIGGAFGIEGFYRLARRKRLVFDRE
jgi:cation-transporting ATPase E